jgi:hypothetical protein
MESNYSHLNTAAENLDWAAKRMMGKQEDADKTPEIIADYAWIRNDEIEGECVEMWPFLVGQKDAADAVAKFVNDERWPVRIMANLTNFMLSISNDDPEQFSWNNENRDRRAISEWLDQYREEDPDPTEP